MEHFAPSEIAVVVLILWTIVKDTLFQKNKDLKENTTKTIENTYAIRELKSELIKLARLPTDISSAHTKIRVIEERIKNLEE